MRRGPYQSVISRSLAGWLTARRGPSAIRHQLLVDLHVFESVVGQSVDEESINVAAPAGTRTEICDEDERRRVKVDLLDLRVVSLPLRGVLLEVGLVDLAVQVGVVVARPIRERARPAAHRVIHDL